MQDAKVEMLHCGIEIDRRLLEGLFGFNDAINRAPHGGRFPGVYALGDSDEFEKNLGSTDPINRE
ncbi:hypothetical protein DFR29_12439 [Tahibacter aquaticus]|uniref:Uncharacterized protein n=2 Tax=Tahibacter aquaticus TaxID=520092 RepID=A0A4R6YKS7_9GAMM|nr:hypothetical protein DFR29_12439 [Tahibacter aquaticus]